MGALTIAPGAAGLAAWWCGRPLLGAMLLAASGSLAWLAMKAHRDAAEDLAAERVEGRDCEGRAR